MIHEILNQDDETIVNEKMIVEINHALDHDLEYTYFDKKRIDIVIDKRTDKERVTVVEVEV